MESTIAIDEDLGGQSETTPSQESPAATLSQETPKSGTKALIQELFEKQGDKSKCKVCHKEITCAKGNTSSATRHAASFHKREWEEVQKKSKQAQQRTIQDCFGSQAAYGISSARRAKLNEKVVGLIVKDLQPLSVVEDDGFRELCQEMDRRYVLPSRKTVREKLLPEMYEKVMKKVQEELDKAKHVGITTDMWTSSSTDSFNTVTAHYLDALGKLKARILECALFEGRHTAEALEAELKKVAQKFRIESKLSAGVSDNAQNIKKALQDFGIPSIPCFAHSLNLVVHDGMKHSPDIVNLRDKVAATVSLTHRSCNAKASLMRCQKNLGSKDEKILIQSVPTRWNSLFLMLERFLELKDALVLFFAQEKSDKSLTNEEWQDVEDLVQLLRPLYDATVEISGEKFTTMSKVIPLSNLLLSYYGSEAKECMVGRFKKELSKSLQARFRWAEGFLNYAVATILDPRFKQVAFSSPLKVSQAVTMAKAEALREAGDDSHDGGQPFDEPKLKKVFSN